jgi:hypothetical protein
VLRSGDGSHKFSKEAKQSGKESNDNETERFGESFWGFGENAITNYKQNNQNNLQLRRR